MIWCIQTLSQRREILKRREEYEREKRLWIQFRIPDGRDRLGRRSGQHLGIPQQDGRQRRLHVPHHLPDSGGLLRLHRHGGRAGHRPQDRRGRRARLSAAVKALQVDRLDGRCVGVSHHELLLRPRRVLPEVHGAELRQPHRRGLRLERARRRGRVRRAAR